MAATDGRGAHGLARRRRARAAACAAVSIAALTVAVAPALANDGWLFPNDYSPPDAGQSGTPGLTGAYVWIDFQNNTDRHLNLWPSGIEPPTGGVVWAPDPVTALSIGTATIGVANAGSGVAASTVVRQATLGGAAPSDNTSSAIPNLFPRLEIGNGGGDFVGPNTWGLKNITTSSQLEDPGAEFYPLPTAMGWRPGVACWHNGRLPDRQGKWASALMLQQAGCAQAPGGPRQLDDWGGRPPGADDTTPDFPNLFPGAFSERPSGSAPPITSTQSGIITLADALNTACVVAFGANDTCTSAQAVGSSDFALPAQTPVDTDVTSFQVQQGSPIAPKVDVANEATFSNTTSAAGTQKLSYSQTTGTTSTSTTTKGGTIGGSVQAGFKLGTKADQNLWVATEQETVEASAGFTVTGSYNFSSTDSTATNNSTSVGQEADIPVPAGTEVTAVAFTKSDNVGPSYTADITLGSTSATSPNTQPHFSAYYQALGMSPTQEQYCIGYLAGDATVPQSILNIAAQQAQSGATGAQHLQSLAAQFQGTAKAPGCGPGAAGYFPASMRSAMLIDVQGFVKAKQYVDTIVCTWQKPLSGGKQAPAAAQPQGCPQTPPSSGQQSTATRQGSATGRASAPGFWYDAADTDARTVHGGPGGDWITGTPGAPRALHGHGGDDFITGGPAGETLRGQAGSDLLRGRGGDDVLLGGPGDDTHEGGAGDDRIIEVAGRNYVEGGPGDDLIASGPRASGIHEGGAGDDRLVAKGRVTMLGGTGDDVYTVGPKARVTIHERPGEGRDRVQTARSMQIPLHVEVMRATGRRDLSLRGNDDDETIIGNRGDNRIAGGPGADTIVAGAGDDRIELGQFGYDTVTTGPGEDTLVPDGVPIDGIRSPHLRNLRERTAHVVRDFRPDQGDRIHLTRKAFGDTLVQLERDFELVQGPGATATSGTPTLVFDTDTKLLTYDPDGTAENDDRVIAVLRGVDALDRSAFRFTT